MIALSESIEVKVTANDTDTREYWTNIIATELAHAAGGFTRSDCVGGWVSDTGELIVETSISLLAYTDNAERVLSHILPVLGQFGHSARQDAVLVVVNGQARIFESVELLALAV